MIKLDTECESILLRAARSVDDDRRDEFFSRVAEILRASDKITKSRVAFAIFSTLKKMRKISDDECSGRG